MESQSPQADINPYAAPLGEAQADWSLVAGVGCWRHGSLLVVHEDAQLPPICVKTGKPATGYRPTKIYWSHPLRWPWEFVQFQVPLSAWSLYSFGRGRSIGLWVAIILTGVDVGALVVLGFLGRITEDTLLAAACGGILGLCLLAGWLALAQPLHFVRRRGKYYWVSGARRPFLEQLPTWLFR